MKKLSVLALLLAVMLLLTACGGKEADPEKALEGTWKGVTDPTESVTFQDGKGFFSYKDSDYVDDFDYTLDVSAGRIVLPGAAYQMLYYKVSGNELTLTFAEGFGGGEPQVKTYKKQ